MNGFVQCEKLALIDLNVREHKRISNIQLAELINITEAIQGIFDYT